MASRNTNHLGAAMEPIDRAGITELVVQRIKELLERGELKAGSRLPPNANWPMCFTSAAPRCAPRSRLSR